MYKLNRPARRRLEYRKAFLLIVVVAALMGGVFWFINHQGKSKLKNNSKPLVTKITGPKVAAYLKVDQPLYTMQLPGTWKEIPGDDINYHYIQWDYTGKDSVGHWLRVYTDTIPTDFAVNYLLPVSASGDHVTTGQQSENCVTFTGNATNGTSRDVATQQNQATIAARWQQIDFLCDNSHVSHQVVGIGSAEGINRVSVTGNTFGKHQYFFVYSDSDYYPDFSTIINILTTFKAK